MLNGLKAAKIDNENIKRRNQKSLSEEIKSLKRIVFDTEDIIKDYPNDGMLKYTHIQDKYRLEMLENKYKDEYEND